MTTPNYRQMWKYILLAASIVVLFLAWFVPVMKKYMHYNQRPPLNFHRAMAGLELSAFGAPHFSPIVSDAIVPLGPSCLAAYHLKRAGLRTSPYPLDWTLFDNKNAHLSTLTHLFNTRFRPLVHLDTSQLHNENITLANGTLVPSIVHQDLGIRWIHDDPLKDSSKVQRRSDILVRRLKHAHAIQLLFVVAWKARAFPTPTATFLKHIELLLHSIDAWYDNTVPTYQLLLVFESHPYDPHYVAMKEQIHRIDDKLIVVPILPSSTKEEWGNEIGWDALMNRLKS